jgi:hypothetical protein
MTIREAVKEIDAVFGAGYAKENPGLVGSVLQADALKEIDKTLVEAIENAVKLTGNVSLLGKLLG